MTLFMKFFVLVLWGLHCPTIEKDEYELELSAFHDLSIAFEQCSFFVVDFQNQHRRTTGRTTERVIAKRHKYGTAPIQMAFVKSFLFS